MKMQHQSESHSFHNLHFSFLNQGYHVCECITPNSISILFNEYTDLENQPLTLMAVLAHIHTQSNM